MKRISLILALFTAIPLASTACSKDDDGGGGGDGDGDGDGTGGLMGGDGDGDGTGGSGDGDGDGDTGGMSGDGDGDTGGTAMGGDGMGGDGMGGMGGSMDTMDVETMIATVCAVRAQEGCLFEMTAQNCITAYEMAYNDACGDEWVARLTCEVMLDDGADWECQMPGGFTATYSSEGEAVCGQAFQDYQTCDN